MKKLRQMKILGASLVGAAVLFFGGIVAWGGFNTAMEATNTTGFCITCHEAAGDEQQQLFFIPQEYRIEFLTLD